MRGHVHPAGSARLAPLNPYPWSRSTVTWGTLRRNARPPGAAAPPPFLRRSARPWSRWSPGSPSANPKRADRHELAAALVSEGDALRERLEAARGADEAAYGAVVAAGALPKATPEDKAARTERVQTALGAAAEAPLETARLALAVLWLADRALGLGNPHLVSDLGCAAEFAAAGLLAAAYNVRANHAYLRDREVLRTQEATLSELAAEGQIVLDRVRVGVSVVLGRQPTPL